MKKTIFRRFLPVCLAAVVAGAALAGCGSSGNTAESTSAAAATTAASADSGKPAAWIADRTITVQAYVDDIGNSLPANLDNTAVMQELTKRTGIKLKLQYTPGDSDSAVMASQLASGTIPDVIISYLDNSTRPEFPILLKAAKEGLFADVSQLMKDSKVYTHYSEEGYLPSDSYKNITFRKDFNGKVYLLPLSITAKDTSTVFNPQDSYVGGMYIQKKIADKLGIDPRQIRTQEQFYDLLAKIKNGGFKDDNGNAVYALGPKYWGGSVDSLDYIVRGYDWGVSDGYNIDKDGSIKHEAETDYAFKKIDFVRKLLAQGLMNPEFFTMDSTRADEASRSHNSAVIADVHNYMDIIYANEDWVPLGPLNDYTGDNAIVTNGKKINGAWAISAKAEKPEEIFKLFDYLATPEGQLLAQYGVEGQSYTLKDGKPVLTEEALKNLNDGNKDYLVNKIGAGFGGAGCIFFYFTQTNIDNLELFGETRPGAGASTTFARSVQVAKDYPRTYKLIPGLKATAYLSADSMTEVKAQLSLLKYKDMLVQAMFAGSDAEAKKIVESFRSQMKAAGNEKFEAYLKELYTQDKTSISFY